LAPERCRGATKLFVIPFFTFHYGMFVTVPALMFRPYGRVMVLHVVILVGGFLVAQLGSPLIPLALLVVLKTGLDLSGHMREHAARQE
jgi:hypothetical protein